MTLAASYSLKTGSFGAYFDSIHSAAIPERFSAAFMADLGFDQTNDRQFLGVLKDLGFIDDDGKPTQRYIEYLDKSESGKILADGVRESFEDLFAINKKANEMDLDALRGKLKVLYKGKKSDLTVERIAKTFLSLCELADFTRATGEKKQRATSDDGKTKTSNKIAENPDVPNMESGRDHNAKLSSLSVEGLQYHINIVLPDSRDPATYDAIFSSLRRHLG